MLQTKRFQISTLAILLRLHKIFENLYKDCRSKSFLFGEKDFNELKLRSVAVSSHKKYQMEIRSD